MPKKREFEWDPLKNLKNLFKHGITFGETRKFWNDKNRIILSAFRPEDGEAREKIIARHKGKIWRAVFVYRGRKIRLISAREAPDSEIRIYRAAKEADHKRRT